MVKLKSLLIFLFVMSHWTFLAQEDFLLKAQLKIKENQEKLQHWEAKLQTAREKNDLYTEMIVLNDIIGFKIMYYGDTTSSFGDLLYLESLIQANPNNKAIPKIIVYFNTLMGSALGSQERFEEAIPYHEKAIEGAKKYHLTDDYGNASSLLALSFQRLGRREDAIKLFKKVEREAIETNNKGMLTRSYEIRSHFFLNENQVDSALFYAKKSIDNSAPFNYQSFRLSRVAECYLILKTDIDSVVYYAEKALDIAIKNQLVQEERYARDNLRQAYGRLGNYEKGYDQFMKFYELKENQRSYENALQIGNLINKKEEEKAQFQKVLSDQKLLNQRLIIWLVSGSLFLLVIVGFFTLKSLLFIKKQKKIIEKEKERAEQSEKHKEQFLANMSHEIRTPMHAISGITNTLIRNEHPIAQDAYLEAMKTSSENLLVLLDDILDLSKIESGKLQIDHVLLNPRTVIENAIKVLRYRAQDKGLELVSKVDEKVPDQIVGDSARLNQILVNLVGNSIKFTETGSVVVGCSIQSYDDRPMLLFSVSDTGIGITEGRRESIFESFEQGDKSMSQIFKGTGLGLSISKKLVELLDGSIWVESELGIGSQFYFILPLITESSEHIKTAIITESDLLDLGKALKGIRILLGEDDEFNVMVIEDDLNYYIPNVHLVVAKNGEEVIAKYQEEVFDLILMDMHMPVMDGIKATERIRALEQEAGVEMQIPIIAMTANIIKSEIDKCLASGMDDFIPKPYKPQQMMGTLKKFLTH